ncbi:hypothetical protein [Arthrobacter antibioticus]|nr:hypothetical protein [Arthrobacter sp. H35-MC1]MDJ0317311.1 hypothetical protein [Arthrobacter sp. H35-MC1]
MFKVIRPPVRLSAELISAVLNSAVLINTACSTAHLLTAAEAGPQYQ